MDGRIERLEIARMNVQAIGAINVAGLSMEKRVEVSRAYRKAMQEFADAWSAVNSPTPPDTE